MYVKFGKFTSNRSVAQYPGYNTKQSNGEAPVMLKLCRNAEYPFIAIALRYTLEW